MYVGTGWRAYSGLVPNRMLKNVEGRRFEDVTMSSGTGHLQNGQGVSFADWDCDGDLDLFVETGGAVPGNRSHNLLFRNPGHDNHWLKVRLVGTRTNRAALGAKVRVETELKDGRKRSIVRTVGQNSSFGGNSLLQSIGLHDATRVAELTVTWPTSRTTQTFRDIALRPGNRDHGGSGLLSRLSPATAADRRPVDRIGRPVENVVENVASVRGILIRDERTPAFGLASLNR